jgi:hypothetical protein
MSTEDRYRYERVLLHVGLTLIRCAFCASHDIYGRCDSEYFVVPFRLARRVKPAVYSGNDPSMGGE